MTAPKRASGEDGRDLLLRHKRELEQVIAENAFVCTTTEARRWLRQVNMLRAQPHRHDEAVWLFGPNMHGPALDILYRTARLHSRDAFAQPVEEGFTLANPTRRARGSFEQTRKDAA